MYVEKLSSKVISADFCNSNANDNPQNEVYVVEPNTKIISADFAIPMQNIIS